MPTEPAAGPVLSDQGATPPRIEVSAGVIEYTDSGGDGPPLVLLHGLLMDGSLWDEVVENLSGDHRCVVPTLPLGAHRHGMSPDADLSLEAIAAMVRELIERLDLRSVTVVGVDTGGALVQLLMAQGDPQIACSVLISCDAFDNFPPGLTGKTLVLAGKLPPALFGLFMQQLRLRPIRRSPMAFGWLTKRGDQATRRWLRPLLTQPEIRRDTVRVLRAIAANRNLMLETAERLPAFSRPALVVWAEGDRVMPPEHGHRMTQLLPQARLVMLSDTYTLVPLDQPAQLAEHIRDLTHNSGTNSATLENRR
jgi:pimeloyl-ACP methyl ester carboxylesterase